MMSKRLNPINFKISSFRRAPIFKSPLVTEQIPLKHKWNLPQTERGFIELSAADEVMRGGNSFDPIAEWSPLETPLEAFETSLVEDWENELANMLESTTHDAAALPNAGEARANVVAYLAMQQSYDDLQLENLEMVKSEQYSFSSSLAAETQKINTSLESSIEQSQLNPLNSSPGIVRRIINQSHNFPPNNKILTRDENVLSFKNQGYSIKLDNNIGGGNSIGGGGGNDWNSEGDGNGWGNEVKIVFLCFVLVALAKILLQYSQKHLQRFLKKLLKKRKNRASKQVKRSLKEALKRFEAISAGLATFLIYPPSWPLAWRLIRFELISMLPQPYRLLAEDILPQGGRVFEFLAQFAGWFCFALFVLYSGVFGIKIFQNFYLTYGPRLQSIFGFFDFQESTQLPVRYLIKLLKAFFSTVLLACSFNFIKKLENKNDYSPNYLIFLQNLVIGFLFFIGSFFIIFEKVYLQKLALFLIGKQVVFLLAHCQIGRFLLVTAATSVFRVPCLNSFVFYFWVLFYILGGYNLVFLASSNLFPLNIE